MSYFCDWCGKKVEGEPLVFKSQEIIKLDGTEIWVCPKCLNSFNNGEYDKINLKVVSHNSQKAKHLNSLMSNNY